jgi:hypothetical protein
MILDLSTAKLILATAISPSFTQATKESRLAQIEILSVYG